MTKRIGLVLLSLIMLLNICTFAAEPEDPSLLEAMSAEVYETNSGDKLPYRLYVPEDYTDDKEYSFLLFLHGAGDRGDDNEKQISVNTNLISRIINGEKVTYDGKEIDTSKEFIIIAPQCPKEMQWVDTPWGKTPDPSYKIDEVKQSKNMTLLMGLIDSLKTKYSIDPERMYITGLSMGGFGTWDLIMRYPDMWAAAIPMGGGADLSKADVIKNTPVWTFHQYLDGVVSSLGTQNIVKELVKAGAEVKFTTYFDPQHNAWTKGYAEKDMLQWLYSHKNSDKNTMHSTSLLNGVSAWAEDEAALAIGLGLVPESVSADYAANIDREAFCEMVVKMFADDVEIAKAPFADVDNVSVDKAYALGIVNGVSDTEFNPDSAITREEICAMLSRAYRKIATIEETEPSLSDFKDKDMISDWAVEDVSFISSVGIMKGDPDGSIRPNDNTTNEEGILLVLRTYIEANSYGKIQ